MLNTLYPKQLTNNLPLYTFSHQTSHISRSKTPTYQVHQQAGPRETTLGTATRLSTRCNILK